MTPLHQQECSSSKAQRRAFATGNWRNAPGAVGLICAGIIKIDPGKPAYLTPLGEALLTHILTEEQQP